MNSYLSGYLSSIPESEYKAILGFLKDHMSNSLNMPKEDFEMFLNEIMKNNEVVSLEDDPKSNEKPSDTYNRFFNKASVDLIYLFKIIGSLYKAVDNYKYLSSSFISDIKSELEKLELKIIELKAKRSNDENTILISETFKNTESFEKYNKDTAYLFSDRDGLPLEPVDLSHNNSDDMIVLKIEEDKDLLHNNDAKTIAMIEVVDYRGVPSDTYSGKKNAIDNSDTSYWDCSVLSNEKIEVPMDEFPTGGAYIKFKVKLSKVSHISEISLTPLCIYPVEICKVSMDNKNILSYIDNAVNVSTDTMTFNFKPIATDEIEIVLRQRNYLYEMIKTNSKMDELNELVNTVLENKKESFITDPRNKTGYTDNDIFEQYSDKHQEEIRNWAKKYIREV